MFDWMFSVLSATIIIIIFAAVSNQFHGLGEFVSSLFVSSETNDSNNLQWVVLVLYGIAGTLLAYAMSLIMASPLAAFAAATGYQVFMFVVSNLLFFFCRSSPTLQLKLYLAGYLLTLTYAKTSSAGMIITTLNFTLSVLSPVASTVSVSVHSHHLF